MSKRQLLIIVGIAVMAFLFLGFPTALDKILALIFGVVILIIAFKLKPAVKQSSSGPVPYVEYKNNFAIQNKVTVDQKISNQPETIVDQKETITNPDSPMTS